MEAADFAPDDTIPEMGPMLAVSPAVPLLLVGICLGASVVGFLIWVSLADRAEGAADTSGGTTEDDSISTAGTDG